MRKLWQRKDGIETHYPHGQPLEGETLTFEMVEAAIGPEAAQALFPEPQPRTSMDAVTDTMLEDICKCCRKPPDGKLSDHLELGYCFPCYLVNVEKRAPLGSCGHRP